MGKRLGVIVVLGGLLFGCVAVGKAAWDSACRDTVQRIGQEIVFIGFHVNYSESYCNHGYFIDNCGDKYFFDVSDVFGRRPLESFSLDALYDYLAEHKEEYEKAPFLEEKQLCDAYTYLNLIDPEAEITEECVMVDFGALCLYGVRLSESGEREFILLEQYGDWELFNQDAYARSIVEIMGGEAWTDVY